uniref:ST8 alpha-N-acetyl-neuraminide alpha-2,8-sialyltransferase 1 n=1 Tax=Equus caballus TaxID=9796 RepID=A0A9L0R592_HORSE
MSPCGRARRHTSRGAMAVLAWKFPRTRLPVGASALCVVVLCWLYIFPVYRLPNEKEIVQGVLQQGTAWRRNQTAARVFRVSRDCSLISSPVWSSAPSLGPLCALPAPHSSRQVPRHWTSPADCEITIKMPFCCS